MTRLPSISVLCPSFARPERLQEAIRCFLDQDYSGPKQMLVLNTFPRQTLLGDFPNVRIINLPQRPPSLGTARNWACQTATGEILINLDDDDFMLPSCLRMYAEAFAESNADWVRFTPTFYAEAWQVKNTLAQWANSVAFRRSAWDRVGKYASHLSCGEDQNFFGRLSAQSQGLTVELAPHEVPMIYCWANQVYHLSGGGPDQPGNVTAYARALLDAEQRIAKGQLKTGVITLTPGYEPGHDPRQMVRHYLDHLPASPAKDSGDVCVIELGRYGDLINILPICRHIALTYRKPFLMVSREFAPLLEGVSYVEPLIVPLKNDQLSEAIALAKKDFKIVLQAQAWGKGWHQEKKCESYNMESWHNAGFLHQFPDRSWRPVFDRRDPAREAALVAKLKAPGKPLLLVNVTHSVSSPFQGERLLSLIRNELGGAFEIVDLATTRFERLYDLLGVMEHSAALVCIDTAPLHLAAAANLPVVAITNSLPWQGTTCRMPAKVIGYHEAFGNPARVIATLREALAQPAPELPPLHTGLTIPRRIFHAVEQHEETDRAAELRKRRARYSWDQLYKRGVIPCPYGPYQRNARAIGCARDLPYLKDVLAHAMAKAHDHDIILWTNDDTVLHPQLVARLQFHLAVYGPCMAMTCDIADEKFPSLNAPPEAFLALGQTHFGRDLFAFEKRWLAAHWLELPDFLIGASEFDNCLAAMVRRHYGIPTPWPSLAESLYPADLPKGLVAHVAHLPAWKQGPHLPEQRHNLGLLEKWAQEHCPSLRRPQKPGLMPAAPVPAKTLTVRRTNSLGDTLAATCVADALIRQGYKVEFQSHPNTHPILRRHPRLEAALSPAGKPDVDLDGAYEHHPHRTRRHFAHMFFERANQQLAHRGILLGEPRNFAPRILADPIARARLLPLMQRHPRPWVLICPRSASFIHRSVPVKTWEQVAGQIPGSKFWLGFDAAPPGFVDLQCRDVESLIEFLGLADLLISTDTGPLHIAAALGTPAVAILQSSSPELHLSDQRDWVMIQPAGLDCLNCQQDICQVNAKDPPCQYLTADQIAAAANHRLRAVITEDVSAVISIYRPTAERLNRCLAAALPQVQEVIVTRAADGVLPAGVRTDPKLRFVVKNETGIGYGRNANFGARHANGKYLLFLNDDVYLAPGAVAALRQCMTEGVGSVAHLLRYPDGTIQHEGKFRPPGHVGFGHLNHKGRNPVLHSVVEMESVTGASNLVRRQAFYDAGAFDEDFFLYSEDDAFCLQLRGAGWKILYTPFASAVHDEHSSTSQVASLKSLVTAADKLFAQKWGPYFSHNATRTPGNFTYLHA